MQTIYMEEEQFLDWNNTVSLSMSRDSESAIIFLKAYGQIKMRSGYFWLELKKQPTRS